MVCEAFRLFLEGNCVSHTSSSMIVLGKQVREVWKIPRIPPRASPSEEYSEFPDFSSLFTQDYIRQTMRTSYVIKRANCDPSNLYLALDFHLTGSRQQFRTRVGLEEGLSCAGTAQWRLESGAGRQGGKR